MSTDDERPRTTTIVLIRHGESVGNATRTISHFRTCGGLSDAGRAQCELLAKRLDRTGELRGAVLYASHVRRAMETAEFIAPVIGAEIRTDERFAELDPGDECDGMTYEDLIARFSPDWSLEDPDGEIYPGGETVAACTPASPPPSTSWSLGTPDSWWRSAPTAGLSTWPCASACGCRSAGGSTCSRMNTSLTEMTDTGRGEVADRSVQRRRPPARRILAVTRRP